MPKTIHDSVMDAGLNVIKTATVMHVCSTLDATPTRAEVIAASLADVVIDGTDFTGPADGDVSGRKLTTTQQAAIPIDVSGTADHVAVIDATNCLAATTCTSQALTAGGTVTVPAYVIDEIRDAT